LSSQQDGSRGEQLTQEDLFGRGEAAASNTCRAYALKFCPPATAWRVAYSSSDSLALMHFSRGVGMCVVLLLSMTPQQGCGLNSQCINGFRARAVRVPLP
jgi:hypothetical protein